MRSRSGLVVTRIFLKEGFFNIVSPHLQTLLQDKSCRMKAKFTLATIFAFFGEAAHLQIIISGILSCIEYRSCIDWLFRKKEALWDWPSLLWKTSLVSLDHSWRKSVVKHQNPLNNFEFWPMTPPYVAMIWNGFASRLNRISVKILACSLKWDNLSTHVTSSILGIA